MLHHVMLTLSPFHTGKASDTPLAQPPTSEKDAQNKMEQRGERLFPVSPAPFTVHWHVDGAFQKLKHPERPPSQKEQN